MVASEPGGTGIEKIHTLAELGYDYVELPLAQISTMGAEEFRELKRAVDGSGVRCETCNNFFPGELRLIGEGSDPRKALEYAGRGLERAQALGVEYAGFGSGAVRSVPEGVSAEEGYDRLAEFLRELGALAGKHHITVLIEPLRKAESNLINTYEEGCRLAADVASPGVKMLADFYHMAVEAEPAEHLLKFGRGSLCHTHIANPAGRAFPADESEADYASFFSALEKIGYNGRISCEAYTENFEKDAGKALEFLRRNCGR